MVRHEEYLPIEGEEEITMDQVRHWQRSFISKDTKFPFHDYMPHDFRRLAITLMCFDFTSLRSVSEIYHEDESTTSMYYQWALTERKKGSANKFKLIGE